MRRAANTAMDTIDAMLCELHQVRAQLVSEIRASDDETIRQADAILASARRAVQAPAAAAGPDRDHL